ncbi:hypothetical protein Hsero_1627 [Herbaspirillum seropedicae SmR1]|uniref:Uncharacterized protein n=1 Tax=Herbaspirillum seropedicae (strain SmR1) TaxID=757424 RepID=D8IQM9_HERSS|nr:hypothetical protein Hsero_1627 [Herbaspirillum seropedicae SmR1]
MARLKSCCGWSTHPRRSVDEPSACIFGQSSALWAPSECRCATRRKALYFKVIRFFPQMRLIQITYK